MAAAESYPDDLKYHEEHDWARVEGDEAIHSILDVMYTKGPYTVIQRAMHIHPTVSELIPTMLGDLQALQ